MVGVVGLLASGGEATSSRAASAESCRWRAAAVQDPHARLFDRFDSVATTPSGRAWAVGDYYTGPRAGRMVRSSRSGRGGAGGWLEGRCQTRPAGRCPHPARVMLGRSATSCSSVGTVIVGRRSRRQGFGAVASFTPSRRKLILHGPSVSAGGVTARSARPWLSAGTAAAGVWCRPPTLPPRATVTTGSCKR